MSRALRLLFVCVVVSCSVQNNAQVLSESQVESIHAAVAQTVGELSALKAFEVSLGLPADLTKDQMQAVVDELWQAYRNGMLQAKSEQQVVLGELPPTMTALIAQAQEGGGINISASILPLGKHQMPFAVIRREAQGVPEAGRPLFICTHGGGQNADASGPHAWDINSREWQVQIQFSVQLYEPEGLYFVPRMADDRLGRWRHAHHQDQFELAIRHGILFWGVDPNRVYKLGISQGGFASAILGAFMPDLFAGINPMAAGVGLGNPAENLRNLPCFTSVGEKDTMFNRAGHAIAFHERLDALKEEDPKAYLHHLDLQAGRGHGIDYQPGAKWIAKHSRNPYPETIVWTSKEQDERRRDAVYWLELAGENLQGEIALTAKIDREKNHVALTAHQLATETADGDPTQVGEVESEAKPLSGATVSVLLNDVLLDLDRPVTVTCNDKEVFSGQVKRDANTMLQTLIQRGDWNYAFPVRIPVVLD